MAKRHGYQNGQRNAGALLRRIYSGYLCPRHHLSTEGSCRDDGEDIGRVSQSTAKQKSICLQTFHVVFKLLLRKQHTSDITASRVLL